MKLCHEIFNKNHHIYFDNLFTSVPFINNLLQQNTYACGTACLNKRHLPDAVRWLGRMVHGAYKSYQYGNTNLVATVWQDNKTVRVLSTNSNPRNVLETGHRIGRDVVQINQPENVNLYNKHINGVDWHDQLWLQYPVGRFAKKSWKYLLWFLVNASIVNAYILYQKTSTRPTKQRYSHLDFCWDLALGLIAGFSSHKHKAKDPPYVSPVMPVNEATHGSFHIGLKQTRRCKWHSMQKWVGKIQCMDANCVVYTFVRRVATIHTITGNFKIQKNILFFYLNTFVFSGFFLNFFLKIKTFNFWGNFYCFDQVPQHLPRKTHCLPKDFLEMKWTFYYPPVKIWVIKINGTTSKGKAIYPTLPYPDTHGIQSFTWHRQDLCYHIK